MTTAMIPQQHAPALDPSIIQQVLLGGDLSRLTPEQRLSYYNRVCESVGLNPLTQPFAYLRLSGKEVLYAKKDATDQLRSIHKVSIEKLEKDRIEDVFVVTAYARNAEGRTDSATGAVTIAGLKGDALANALMKAETKAKRRVTLSICGLGMLDETEVETIPQPQTEKPAAMEVKALAPPPEDGETRVVEVGKQMKVGQFWYAPITLTGGVILRAKGDDLIQLCRDLCGDGSPVTVQTRAVQKKDGTQTEEIVSIHRKYPLMPEPVLAPDVAEALGAEAF